MTKQLTDIQQTVNLVHSIRFAAIRSFLLGFTGHTLRIDFGQNNRINGIEFDNRLAC